MLLLMSRILLLPHPHQQEVVVEVAGVVNQSQTH
jgi:hypothetical protein